MGKNRNGALLEKHVKISPTDDEENEKKSKKVREKSVSDSQEDRKRSKSRGKTRESSDSDEEDIKHKKSESRKRKSRKEYSSEDSESGSDSEYSSTASESESENSSLAESESETERRRRKRREKRRREREEERERKRRKREKEKRRRKKKDKIKKKKKEKKERGKTGAVTNSWGKYGIIRETDMWNKRPEFTAWLAEVKQVNLEHLSNWEEKQMFKEFMEDHNTATFTSKKYYSLDQYHRRKIEKAVKKGMKKVTETERTVFNDEEQRRQELMQLREKKKEEEVESLKREMQSGLAQAMKEQAQLKEEMTYQYKIGNFEAAAAIQRRLDPDVPM